MSVALENGETFDAPNQTGSPERNLILGVLERAILDFVGNDANEMEEARAWLFDDDSGNQAFSFEWICEQLDLESQDIRNMVQAMPKRGKHKVAPWYFQKHEDKNHNEQALCA